MNLNRIIKSIVTLSIIIFIFNLTIDVNAQEKKKLFIDTTDNAFDVSEFLNSVTGFLPIPLLITEPAVGLGGGLGIVYFHKKKNKENKGKYGPLPPVMTMAFVAKTSNKTFISVFGHKGSYKRDRFRYTGFVGFTDVNLAFYSDRFSQFEKKFKFNLNGWFTFQEFIARPIKEHAFFVGANYIYFNNIASFETGLSNPDLALLEKKTNTAGINSVFLWDSRDNFFTPNKGIYASINLGIYDPVLGGDNNYNHFELNALAYTPFFSQKIISGYRTTFESKVGDPAFYELPFIYMRGIPIMRYQDNMVGLVETEWRWNIIKRWSLVGFAGAGFTSPDINSFKIKDGKVSFGGGFRYFLAKQYNMHAGIDIAKGPEEYAIYLIFGSNWIR